MYGWSVVTSDFAGFVLYSRLLLVFTPMIRHDHRGKFRLILEAEPKTAYFSNPRIYVVVRGLRFRFKNYQGFTPMGVVTLSL